MSDLDFLLRSLRDLEAEHSAGDIDDEDYLALKDDYTARAAALLRLGDPDLSAPAAGSSSSSVSSPSSGSSPLPDSAGPSEPSAARESVSSRESGPEGESAPARGSRRWPGWVHAAVGILARRWPRRVLVAVGIVVVAGGMVWTIRAATSPRTTGETVTGEQLGQSRINQLLASAQQASDKGDALSAVKDYQRILSSDPQQVQALTGEGWILVQTQQTSLVNQGLALLQAAEQADPTYSPAHLYRGVTLIAEGQNRAAVPELQYYLAHNPDPALKSKVEQALAQAQAAPAPSTTAP